MTPSKSKINALTVRFPQGPLVHLACGPALKGPVQQGEPYTFCCVVYQRTRECPGSRSRASWLYGVSNYYFSVTTGTAEPGTIVVGSTPFQRSACTSVTRFGLVPSALARASMAAASASPVSLMLVARASPFSRRAAALAFAS